MKPISDETQEALDHLTTHGWGIIGYNATGVAPDDLDGAARMLLRAGYYIEAPDVAREQMVGSSMVIGIPTDQQLGSGSLTFFDYLRRMWLTHLGKNAGYSGFQSDDSFGNFRQAEDMGVSAFIGCLVRMGDKWSRIKSLVKKTSNEQVGESIDDTLMDLANYAIIALCLRNETTKAAWGTAVAEARKDISSHKDGIAFTGEFVRYGRTDAYNTSMSKSPTES